MKYELEIRTTISPTPYFFRRIHYLAASLRTLRNPADHEIIVSVGGNAPRENLYRSQPWSNRYPILWRWVDPIAYTSRGYEATNCDRIWHMSRARFVMICDADVIFLRDFTELLNDMESSPAICGVMAHFPPFMPSPPLRGVGTERVSADAPASVYWQLLAQSFGIDNLALDYQYSGWGFLFTCAQHQFAPAYFNGGMVIGPSDLMEKMFAFYPAAAEAVEQVMATYFLPQLARTLAIYRTGIPRKALPVRYNFPNDPLYDENYPDELSQVSVLHYLRKEIIDKDTDFANPESCARLIARSDLRGSNELLRARLAELHDEVAGEEIS
jgi:hypothetical protein